MPTAGGDAAFFGMFDGHGGVKAAAWAKDNLSKNVALVLSLPRILSSPLSSRNMHIPPRSFSLFFSRGVKAAVCTATSALLIGRELYVANAGDSRTVICRGTRGTPLSDDHKPDKPSERRRIEHAGGTVTFFGCARVNGVLATSRGFGDQELKQWVTAEPEVKKRILDEGDEFLVLATDGLWDVLSNDDAARIISGEKSVQGAAKKLTSEALRLGTMDNVSAIVLDLRALVAGNLPAPQLFGPVVCGKLPPPLLLSLKLSRLFL
ncbi:phosphatase 2C-like domain-containing protein [Baffinella frigidus]|nr:phosphatase 2C-like domain-containing protein [Cryptophyta sp. CCMP2293]